MDYFADYIAGYTLRHLHTLAGRRRCFRGFGRSKKWRIGANNWPRGRNAKPVYFALLHRIGSREERADPLTALTGSRYDSLQAELEVKIKNLPPANRHDAAAPVRLDPAERGIYQEDCQLPSAKRFTHGQDADLIQLVVEGEGNLRS